MAPRSTTVVTAQEIKALDDEQVHISFLCGCSLEGRIISTMHLDEGDDFIVDVRKQTCHCGACYYAATGDSINIDLEDVAAVDRLTGEHM